MRNMKKFYSTKDSLDRTPIMMRLERRHTLSANEEKPQDVQSEYSARAASISSLDKLSGSSVEPRSRTREVTKCLSEDVLNKGISKVPNRVITEAELSSSLLYKSMQASVNARFKSPNRTPLPHLSSLEPVVLQDSKMKPIPIKLNRSQRRSCFCQFLIVAAITLCTLGFLATIAGITYLEVFANKSLTSYETSEMPVDISGITLDSREDNELHTHNYLIGKESTVPEVSSNEKVFKSSSGATERKNTARIPDTDKSVTEMNQFLNSDKTKIKFQDGETVIYEVKPDNSMKYEKNSNVLGDLKERILDFNESNISRDNETVANEERLDHKFVNAEIFLDSGFHKSQNKLHMENKNSEVKQHDSDFSERQLKDDLESLSQDFISKTPKKSTQLAIPETDNHLKFPEPPSQINEVEAIHSNRIGLIDYNLETNKFHEENKSETNMMEENTEDKFSDTRQEMQVQHEGKTVSSVQNIDENKVAGDHDVDSMVMVVDDLEDKDMDSSLPRNGEINLSEAAATSISNPAAIQSESMYPVTEKNERNVSSQRQVTTEATLPKKTLDMKVSLVEAMKHLQVLDTNNKILSSRSKPGKTKNDNTRKRKQSNSHLKEDDAERLRYLQKLRLLLYDRLQ